MEATKTTKTDTRLPEERGCPQCGAGFKKLYTFGVGQYCGGGCAEVATYRCGHATSTKFDPCGILPATVMDHPDYPDAAGRARLHVMLMRSKGLA